MTAGEPSAVTDGDGNYSISGVVPGTWDVREVQQDGWTCSFPNPGTPAADGTVTSTDCSYNEPFASGDAEHMNNDFGNWTTITKSGQKFNDLNANGVKDAGEPGLEGWTIYVDYSGEGTLDAGEPSAVTDGDGNYSISGVVPGTWDVREVQQDGWTCSFPNPGTPAADGTVTSTDCSYNEPFASGDAEHMNNDFGNWTTITKSGQKFNDLNANGVKDAGEPGLEGWTIYVDYSGGGALTAGEPSAVTDGDGNYSISGVVPGTWDVREVQQDGWTCSFPNPGTPAADGTVTSTDCSYNEPFASGDAEHMNNDFGNWTTITKSGQKFNDLNANGVKDAGEPGLEGWTIYVDYSGGGVLTAGEPSAVTDGDGNYSISGVVPGTWDVREVQQDGWTCSFPNPGTPAADGTVTSTDCSYNEPFASGDAEHMNNDFGNWTTITKSGQKFNDLNANGVKDAGEPGLEGWTIYVDYSGERCPYRR